MLNTAISARAVLIAALLTITALAAFYAPRVLGSGDVPAQVVQGDINCDGLVDARDALGALRHTADLSVDQDEPCFSPGSVAAIPGPQGPQGEPGVSLYALVNAAGTLQRGTAIAATSPFNGTYEVTFAEDVSECAAIANPGAVGSGGISYSHTAIATVGILGDDRIEVYFANHESTPIATDFHLIVAC
jgi:hypothetical protein